MDKKDGHRQKERKNKNKKTQLLNKKDNNNFRIQAP